jgi:hypothetical protein
MPEKMGLDLEDALTRASENAVLRMMGYNRFKSVDS